MSQKYSVQLLKLQEAYSDVSFFFTVSNLSLYKYCSHHYLSLPPSKCMTQKGEPAEAVNGNNRNDHTVYLLQVTIQRIPVIIAFLRTLVSQASTLATHVHFRFVKTYSCTRTDIVHIWKRHSVEIGNFKRENSGKVIIEQKEN